MDFEEIAHVETTLRNALTIPNIDDKTRADIETSLGFIRRDADDVADMMLDIKEGRVCLPKKYLPK